MSEIWERGEHPSQAEVFSPDDHLVAQSCGCPIEYHTSDCPILHGGGSDSPQTKREIYDLMGDGYPDDWPEEGEG